METELSIVKQLWLIDQKQFEISQQNIKLLSLYGHDLKHMVHLLNDRKIEPQYVEEVSQVIEVFDAVKNTGNHALNVILTEKELYCKQEKITFTCIVDGQSLSFIQTADLYSIFGNLLNNAIEAVRVYEEPDKRFIALNVSQKNQMISVHLENYYEGLITLDKHLPQTSKPDKELHGYGLKSVKWLLEKYDGHLSFNYADHLFAVNLLIPMP